MPLFSYLQRWGDGGIGGWSKSTELFWVVIGLTIFLIGERGGTSHRKAQTRLNCSTNKTTDITDRRS